MRKWNIPNFGGFGYLRGKYESYIRKRKQSDERSFDCIRYNYLYKEKFPNMATKKPLLQTNDTVECSSNRNISHPKCDNSG